MKKQSFVRLQLSDQFRDKINEIGGKVENVVEQIAQVGLTFILEIPDDQEEYVQDLAFMTWIKNPKFQKYYKINDQLLAEIKKADEFHEYVIAERAKEKAKLELKTEIMDDQVIVRLILDGVYPFYSKKIDGFIYIVGDNNKVTGTKNKKEFDARWKRELLYLGYGQLSEQQKSEITKYGIPL